MCAGDVIAIHDVGRHKVLIELPDVLHIHYDGDVNLDDFKVMDDFVANYPGREFIYVLRDARQGGQTSLETRTYMARFARTRRIRAIVTYGASFQGRMLVDMTRRAIHALKNDGPELAFVASEEEARRWIEKSRDEYQ